MQATISMPPSMNGKTKAASASNPIGSNFDLNGNTPDTHNRYR